MHDSNRLQRLQQTPLWDFARLFYARPKVEEACLALQDAAGIDVCELLFHCWLYRHGLQAEPAALAEERNTRLRWQREVTAILRQLRRDLKPQAVECESIAALRNTIQQAELQAEHENLQRWEAWALQATKINQRLTKIVISSQEVARWLQDTLLYSAFDACTVSEQRLPESTTRAFEVLARQLDRFE
ncbi:TIGR02444 family protein [Vreelandella olivaria]|uniref:TIGR02444 family protein n=1 Tax=Vreelandella olivaria TaxID=390919 RepID=UPI00201F332F|nr:TIGR02444 family protein [Halomonas olivaria]